MRKTLNRYIRKFKKDRAKRRRFGTMLCALALVVVAGVFWQLRLIGISMTDETGSFDANADLENSSVWEENIPELTEDLVAESIRAMKFEGENYTAAVSFDENAQIPENAELQVTKLTTDTERYVEGVQEALGEGRTLSSVYLFDISIVCDGEIIEPAEGSNVSVNVNFPEKIIADDEQLDVVHFKNDQDPEFLENASLLPNGELGGDSVEFVSDSFSVMAFAVSTRANEEEPVPIPYAAENIEMHLFNYGSNINNTEGFLLEFLHMENKESNGKYGYMPVDGWGHKGQYYPNKFTVDRTLTDGYPTITPWDTAIESKSLRYLFDKTMTEVIGTPHSDGDCTRSPLKSDYASRHYAILNDGSGTGLFQKDSEGYLYYDSAENAASYNSESKKMDLYGYTVKPHKESRLNGFLPFNVGHQGENCQVLPTHW